MKYKVVFEFKNEDTNYYYKKDFLDNNGAGFTDEEAADLLDELKRRDNIRSVGIEEMKGAEKMEKSKIYGIMLLHTDGEKEFYTPELTQADNDKIYKILENYGDENESQRGDLAVNDADNNKINELAGRIWEELAPWERCDTSIEEIAEDMKKDPLSAIGFLLDRLEDNTTTTPDTSKHAELAKRIFDEIGDEWTEDRETETKKIQEDLYKNPIYIFEALATNCKMWRELNDEN